MYNNQEAGPAFTQFLTLLGDVVRLKGFESYRAQLDTKSEAGGSGGGWGMCGGWTGAEGQVALVRATCIVTAPPCTGLGLGPGLKSSGTVRPGKPWAGREDWDGPPRP